MKILIITNMYPSLGDASWRGIFIKEQVIYLSDLYPEIKFDLIHIKGRITKGGSNFNYMFGYLRYFFKILTNKYDLIWSHHRYCTLLALPLFDTPLVYTMHEGFLLTDRNWSLISAEKKSNHVIYVNKKSFVLSNKKNKYFLPSGIDSTVFYPMNYEECRKNFQMKNEIFYVLFPADPLRLEKNAKFLYEFIEENTTWLSSKNIEFIFGGNLDYEEMPLWMNAVDCLVSFSRFESDGMVFKEAMACNLPVITFDVGNAQTYFESHDVGSIIMEDYNALQKELIFWQNKGRSKGRSFLLKLGMDTTGVSQSLMKIFEQVVSIDSK